MSLVKSRSVARKKWAKERERERERDTDRVHPPLISLAKTLVVNIKH